MLSGSLGGCRRISGGMRQVQRGVKYWMMDEDKQRLGRKRAKGPHVYVFAFASTRRGYHWETLGKNLLYRVRGWCCEVCVGRPSLQVGATGAGSGAARASVQASAGARGVWRRESIPAGCPPLASSATRGPVIIFFSPIMSRQCG